MNSPALSPTDGFDLAVVALSARALSCSARRAGLRALAVDLFADADTREHADVAVRSPAARSGMGFDPKALLRTLQAHAPEGLPVVLGAGFEHAPALMRAIARRNPIAGASSDLVARLKHPTTFSTLLSELSVPHPQIGADAGGERISKRIGASGGAHIRRSVGSSRGRRYIQSCMPGRPLSALFIADGRSISVIGFSEQWVDPTRRAPYRYGGAVGPIDPPAALRDSVSSALARITKATRLVGLASADMILPEAGGEDAFVLLEVNPRPGATLDVFDRGDMPSLLALHLDACAGRLPAALPAPAKAQAAAVIYAERPVATGSLPRPVWTADWPSCDETVPAGAPFCTLLAAGPSPFAARALVMERRDALLASLRASPVAAPEHKNTEKAPA